MCCRKRTLATACLSQFIMLTGRPTARSATRPGGGRVRQPALHLQQELGVVAIDPGRAGAPAGSAQEGEWRQRPAAQELDPPDAAANRDGQVRAVGSQRLSRPLVFYQGAMVLEARRALLAGRLARQVA